VRSRGVGVVDPVVRQSLPPLPPDWRQALPKGTTEDEARFFFEGLGQRLERENGQRAQARVEETEEDARVAAHRALRPPAFPLHVLPPDLRTYVEQVATAVICPPDYVAAAVLAVLGSALGAGRVLKIKSTWKDAACLWVALVGRPGEGKSPALSEALFPAEVADAELYQTWRAAQEAYEECQEHEDGEPCPDRPVRERCMVSDVTVEKLAQVLQESPRGVLLHRDEFSGWLHSMNVYRGGRGADQQTYTSIWSGKRIDVLRKTTDDAFVEHPFVAVLGGIQPDRPEEVSRGVEDGFAERLLVVYPATISRRWSDADVDPRLKLGAYVARYETLRSLPDAELELTPAARRAFTEWYDDWNAYLKTTTGYVRGAGEKLQQYCARFALILAHVRQWNTDAEGGPTCVDVEDVRGAVALAGYFSLMMRRADRRLTPPVGNIGRDVKKLDRAAREVAAWLRQHGGGATVRELTKARAGKLARAQDVLDAVEQLEEDGRVAVERLPRPGNQISIKVTLRPCDDCDDDDA
jgi:Protein of unknown function (DUF3987)